MVPPIFEVALLTLVNLMQKVLCKHAEKFVSLVILNPVKFLIRFNHLNSTLHRLSNEHLCILPFSEDTGRVRADSLLAILVPKMGGVKATHPNYRGQVN